MTGIVHTVSKAKSGDVYLNFGGSYPNHIFAVQIKAQNTEKFGDLMDLKNTKIEVEGLIEWVSEKPLIQIQSPEKLKSINGEKSPTEPSSPPLQDSSVANVVGPRELLGVAYGSFGTFQAPLSEKGKKAAKEGGNPEIEQATIGLGIPADFDPAKPARLLLMYTTSDTDFSAVQRARSISRTAMAEGWLVMGADGNPVKPPRITLEWVSTMTEAGLEALHRGIPESKKWKLATAGNSGGASMAGIMSAWVANAGYDLTGILLSAGNRDTVEEGMRLFRPARPFRSTPVFISVGTEDKIAPPTLSKQIEKSLKSSGFDHVRYEEFSGGHFINYEEAAKALRWFVEMESKR